MSTWSAANSQIAALEDDLDHTHRKYMDMYDMYCRAETDFEKLQGKFDDFMAYVEEVQPGLVEAYLAIQKLEDKK